MAAARADGEGQIAASGPPRKRVSGIGAVHARSGRDRSPTASGTADVAGGAEAAGPSQRTRGRRSEATVRLAAVRAASGRAAVKRDRPPASRGAAVRRRT